jgi:hypothetical protein
MLHLLDEAIEAYLRELVPLPAREVAVSFDAPDDAWRSKVSGTTVNLFLWDVRTNLEERQAGLDLEVDADGGATRHPPRPRVDLRYAMTAWTSDVSDEHRLLGEALAAMLANPVVEPEQLPEAYREVRPLPALTVAGPANVDGAAFLETLGGRPRLSLDIVVTATVDVVAGATAGPPVARFEMDLVDRYRPERSSTSQLLGGRAPGRAGEQVRSPRGRGVVDEQDRFVVRAQPGDEVTVESVEPRRATAPSTGEVKIPAGKGRER